MNCRVGCLYCAEHIISIIASLVKNCEGIQRQRLINKFIENDHEKIDRLMELHFKYLDRVNKADDKIEQKKRVSFCLYGVCFTEKCTCSYLAPFLANLWPMLKLEMQPNLNFVLNLTYLTLIFILFYLDLEHLFGGAGNNGNFLMVKFLKN